MIKVAVNLRGLVTSLGAGGSLIAAAICALVIVGGIIAVGGVPDSDARADSGDVVVPAATAKAPADDPVASRATQLAATVAADRPRRRGERSGATASPPARAGRRRG